MKRRRKQTVESLDQISMIFRLISGTPNILEMCKFLCSQDANVTEICKHLNVAQSNTSMYLRLLRMCGLVHRKRDHKFNIYSASEPLKKIMSGIIPLFEEAA
jgi:DNA-binding transcriptional ArsR family regulator